MCWRGAVYRFPTRVFVSGGLSLTVLLARVTGSRGLMVAAVTEPGAAKGGVTALGVGVARDCWLLSRDCRRAGRLFCRTTTQLVFTNVTVHGSTWHSPSSSDPP